MMNMISLMGSAAATESGGVFGALGIDWKILILQAVAFALLVFILAKWVYPPILKMLNQREKMIEDSIKSARDSAKKSADTEAEIAKKLAEARSEATDIVAASREQAQQMLLGAEMAAQKRADATVESARQQLAKDVEAARVTLRRETANLVADATEKVVGEKVDGSTDSRIISRAIAKTEKSVESAEEKN